MKSPTPKDRLDPDVLKAVENAERKDGVSYGPGILDGEQVFLDVTFYPKRKWWLHKGDERTEISISDAQRVKKLAL